MSEVLLTARESGVLSITINRPDQLNALNQEVIEGLTNIFEKDLNDSDRIVVLKGAGEKAFVAGADIKAMSSMSTFQAELFAKKGQYLTRLIEKSKAIVIAQVQGFALGGGCELAMACDMIIASNKAKFGQPEVNLGLIAGFGGTQRLIRRVGQSKAMDLLLSGQARMLDADEALTSGLVNRVVQPDQLEEEIAKVCKGIMKAGPAAVKRTKLLVRTALETPLDAGLEIEAAMFGHCFADSESKEGIEAFLEKRKPQFNS